MLKYGIDNIKVKKLQEKKEVKGSVRSKMMDNDKVDTQKLPSTKIRQFRKLLNVFGLPSEVVEKSFDGCL